jgi:hypothetical protein
MYSMFLSIANALRIEKHVVTDMVLSRSGFSRLAAAPKVDQTGTTGIVLAHIPPSVTMTIY